MSETFFNPGSKVRFHITDDSSLHEITGDPPEDFIREPETDKLSRRAQQLETENAELRRRLTVSGREHEQGLADARASAHKLGMIEGQESAAIELQRTRAEAAEKIEAMRAECNARLRRRDHVVQQEYAARLLAAAHKRGPEVEAVFKSLLAPSLLRKIES